MTVEERLAEVDRLLDTARRLFSAARQLDDEDCRRRVACVMADLHRQRCALLPLQRRPHD